MGLEVSGSHMRNTPRSSNSSKTSLQRISIRTTCSC